MDLNSQIRFVWKPLVWLAGLLPFALILFRIFGYGDPLGANPIETLQDHFGQWGLRFIMITLAITPLRKISGFNPLVRFRRLVGLFAYFYVSMHFLIWFFLDRESDLSTIVEDIVERPFITIGMLALLILTAMAVTSTSGMRRRLARRWQTLHNGIYLVAILGVWHYWWQVKKDISEPLIYAAVLAVLLGFRLWDRRARRISRERSALI